MYPRGGWGQNEACEMLESSKKGKWVTLNSKRELPKLSLYCLLFRRWASQGHGSLQMMNGQQGYNQTQNKIYHLHWSIRVQLWYMALTM